MSEDIIIAKGNCFVCSEIVDENNDVGKSVMESTIFSEKPIYKFIESFTRMKFEVETISKALLCNDCYEQFSEYDKICKEAAKIQENIVNAFNNTQTKFHSERNKCPTCFAQFNSQDELEDHDCIIGTEEEITCEEYVYEEIDEELFKSEASAVSVIKERKLKGPLVYSCAKCDKIFEKKKAYNHHIKLAHLPDGAEVFTCTICGNSEDNIFVSELEFKLHNIIKHPIDKNAPLQCPGCPKQFTNKALLTRHFGLHSQDKPLICELCGKRYFHASSFHMHLMAHKGIKGHKCSECGRSFISTSHLNRHLKTHTGVKAYECSHCGSRFALRYNLRAHLNTHFGITRKRKPKKPKMEVEYLEEVEMAPM